VTIRLVLADDHPLVLDGLAHLFQREDDLQIVARCDDGEAALRAVQEHKPDVLVLDLNMPRLSGVELLRRLAQEGPPVRVVVLSGNVDEDDLLEVVRLGARGVVLKTMAPELLVRCVRAVHAGGQRLESQLAGRALERLLTREAARQQIAKVLTRRELELVSFVSAGLRNKEIAARLHIGEGTVKAHLHNVYEKLGVTSRVELVNYARNERERA
jgi:DNA-binding NarL/FixJ family response regulator